MKCSKRLLSIIMVTIMAVTMLAGCTADSTTKEAGKVGTAANKPVGELKIGLSMQTLGGAYFATQESALKGFCEEKGITFYSADAQGDMTKQLSDVEDLISKDCDVIVINPKDPKGAIAATQACTAAGIPVFIMDNTIDPSADYVSMIQSDNYELGNLVGIDAATQFGTNEIKIGMLSGNQGNALGVARRMGVMKGIMESQLASYNKTSVSILTQGWGNWGQEGGLTATEDMLMAAPEINLIVAENDGMALGALQAIQAAKRNDILIVSVDGQKEVYSAIKDGGQILATGRNDPTECAKKVLETILKWNNGESVQKLIYLEPVSVSSKNIEKYYNPDSPF